MTDGPARPGKCGRHLLPRRVVFTAGDLPRVRRVTAGWAGQAGLGAGRAADLVMAVDEIAANAVRHGSSRARLRLYAEPAAVVAEVHDEGRWRPGAVTLSPDPCRPGRGGLGLLIARRACGHVQILTGRGGTAVLLRMRL